MENIQLYGFCPKKIFYPLFYYVFLKKTWQQHLIFDGGADYCIALKGNQPALLKDTEEYFNAYADEMPKWETTEKEHGRIEKREYRLHWCLDVIFREDAAWARKDSPPRNMNVLRKTALSLLNKAKQGRISKKKMMLKATLNPEVLLSILFCEKK